MVRGREDYLRAWATMQKAKDDGLPRYEGEATTAEGWQFLVIEFVGYYKLGVKGGIDDLPMATVMVTHMATDETIPPRALIEFNRQMQEAKDKFQREMREAREEAERTMPDPKKR